MTRIEIATLLLVPFILIIMDSALLRTIKMVTLLPLLSLPLALWLIIKLWGTVPSPACNQLLASTSKLQLAFGVLFGIGCW